MKGVSLLPLSEHGYAQAPYIATPREEIEEYAATLKPLNFDALNHEGDNQDANKFCDGDVPNLDSPCIKICTLVERVCIGCGRTVQEISEWLKPLIKENKKYNTIKNDRPK